MAPSKSPRAEKERRVTFWLEPGESFRDHDLAPEMVVVPSGTFFMGSSADEGDEEERPLHEVTIPQAFAVGKFLVTFDEWDGAVATGGLSYQAREPGWGRGRRPVINVSWNDAQDYIKWLSSTTDKPYRLLSEAEWEYACRAGSRKAYCFGDNEEELGNYAWYSDNAGGRSHPVGRKKPNAYGLYDMHGNAREWCEDDWHPSHRDKPESLKSTGAAWITKGCECRVLRGGSWSFDARGLRSAYRNEFEADTGTFIIGFRVARDLAP